MAWKLVTFSTDRKDKSGFTSTGILVTVTVQKGKRELVKGAGADPDPFRAGWLAVENATGVTPNGHVPTAGLEEYLAVCVKEVNGIERTRQKRRERK
ncbi:MAG: hypothetical protein PHS53_03205 [Candidatus Pacebacteria bacterium]|nr:hypothetical protein [Candidatus Paceibacterota bacterium]